MSIIWIRRASDRAAGGRDALVKRGQQASCLFAQLGAITTHFRGWIPLGAVLHVLTEKFCSFFLMGIRILSCCLQARPSPVSFEPSSALL